MKTPIALHLPLNPTHPEAANAKIVGANPLAFDPRLWAPL